MIEEFFNKEAKAFSVFIFGLIALGTLVISTQLAVVICSKWYGIIVGIIAMILAIPLHLLAKKHRILYVFGFLLNSIGSGFSVSAYYLTEKIEPDLITLFLSAIPAAAILALIYVVLQIFSKSKNVSVSIAVILNVILLGLAVFHWIKTGDIIFSMAFFCLLQSLFYICVFGVTINHDERYVLRDISFGGFGSFIIITVVVIVIISGGDILEGVDFGGGDGKKKSKKS